MRSADVRTIDGAHPPVDFRVFRRLLWMLRTDRANPSAPGNLCRGILMVPIFGCCLILLKLRALFGRALIVEARTDFGASMRCRMPDLVQMYIAIFGVWEPDQTRYIQRVQKPGRTFIDVGANVGYYTLLAAPIAEEGDDTAAVAIDASPRIHELLKVNLSANEGTSHVRTVNCAVAAEPGELSVFSGPEHNIGLTTTVAGRGFTSEAIVRAEPLGDICTKDETERAQFVKIDVEGGEPAVLAGMDSFLDAAPDDVEILVELSPSWWSDGAETPESVLKPFFDRGFKAYSMPNNYWPWRYLWPNAVRWPRRYRGSLATRPKRIDLVLSRRDVEELTPDHG